MAKTPPPTRTNPPGPPAIYFSDCGGGTYFVDNEDSFLRLSRTDIRLWLRRHGLSDEPQRRGDITEVENFLADTQRDRNIRYAGPLAGYQKGMVLQNGRPVLVTEPPVIIPAADGMNSTMYDYVERLLNDPDHPDQSLYFHAWLKLFRYALVSGDHRSGPAMVLTGGPNEGKTLLSLMVRDMIGGRSADPTDWMKGITQFNAHMFGAELQVIDDKGGDSDWKTRNQFGNALKELVAGGTPQCHAKGQTPFTLYPLWRVLILINNEWENLQVLPPMVRGIQDKIVILKTHPGAIDEPTTTSEEYVAYSKKLRAAIPDYLGWLDAWEIPVEILDGRFGFKTWQHPEILEGLQQFSPEQRLEYLIVEGLQTNKDQVFTTREIETRLKEDGSVVEHEAKDLLRGPGSTGKYLIRLCKTCPRLIETWSRVPGGGSMRFKVRAAEPKPRETV